MTGQPLSCILNIYLSAYYPVCATNTAIILTKLRVTARSVLSDCFKDGFGGYKLVILDYTF